MFVEMLHECSVIITHGNDRQSAFGEKYMKKKIFYLAETFFCLPVTLVNYIVVGLNCTNTSLDA